MGDRWKDVERRLAAELGCHRVPINGRAGADCVGDWLQLEVKSRVTLPAWLLKAVEQSQVQLEGRLGLVCLHRIGDEYGDALIVLRLRDWLAYFGRADKGCADAG